MVARQRVSLALYRPQTQQQTNTAAELAGTVGHALQKASKIIAQFPTLLFAELLLHKIRRQLVATEMLPRRDSSRTNTQTRPLARSEGEIQLALKLVCGKIAQKFRLFGIIGGRIVIVT